MPSESLLLDFRKQVQNHRTISSTPVMQDDRFEDRSIRVINPKGLEDLAHPAKRNSSTLPRIL
ncbi:MAG: hypothetical protein HY395_00625 [Candidatus Doudnabacteria bacterium]|nr:hypothetical protein [Candidatus Doudnabacteria bacterium]